MKSYSSLKNKFKGKSRQISSESRVLPRILLKNLVCPKCKSELIYCKKSNELICKKSKLAFAIIAGIPNMLIEEARKIKDQ